MTYAVSKQLLLIYDKQSVRYPMPTLISACIREILLTTTPADLLAFQRLPEDGSHWGLSLSYSK